MRRTRRHSRGQALVEYAWVVGLFAVIFFTPLPALLLPPDVLTQGEVSPSLFGLFVRVFDIYINSFHAVITLPIP